jgi:hypothetical protein
MVEILITHSKMGTPLTIVSRSLARSLAITPHTMVKVSPFFKVQNFASPLKIKKNEKNENKIPFLPILLNERFCLTLKIKIKIKMIPFLRREDYV